MTEPMVRYSRPCNAPLTEGRCARKKRDGDLFCRPCWFRVPKMVRDQVWRAYREHGTWSAEHRSAVSVAIDWLREHPTSS